MANFAKAVTDNNFETDVLGSENRYSWIFGRNGADRAG